MLGLKKTSAVRVLLMMSLMTLFIAVGVQAQETDSRVLVPGVAATGTLDAENLAQVYTFSGTAGQVAQVALDGTPGIGLLLTATSGATLAQAALAATDSRSGLELPAVTLPADGTYYVTLFIHSVTLDEALGPYTLTLTLDAATSVPATPAVVSPGRIVTTSGIQVSLTWDSTADMNLQVRDPIGGNLFWDSRATDDGGTFGFDANGLCEVLTESPVETASWSAGSLPTGSYEVLVYYRSTCENEGAVNFTIDITVDGNALNPIQGTLTPPITGQEQVYVTSFVVQPDGTTTLGAASVYSNNLTVSPANLPAATPIERDMPIQNAITSQQPFKTYTFNGVANELVSISTTATAGSLDTLLYLLGPNNNVLYSNDDVEFGATDSALNNVRLAVDGQYTIVATRYGQNFGGTEGTFQVLLSGPTQDIPASIQALNLPNGDIEISLLWNTNADLQLLVRDPSGDSVFDDTTTVPSGGRLVANGNVNCTVSETQPVSYIYWPSGFLRAGTYEVDVWYQNECGDTNPVEFTLIARVDGEVVMFETIRPLPGDQYVSSFNIDVNRQVTVYGGAIMNLSDLSLTTEIPTAPTVTSGQPTLGALSYENPYDIYLFEGESGDVLSISLNQISGNLDTLLYVLDPNGNLLQSNDDAVVGEVTDSLISDLSLGQDGNYIIVATRFGIRYGATTGGYELTVTRRN